MSRTMNRRIAALEARAAITDRGPVHVIVFFGGEEGRLAELRDRFGDNPPTNLEFIELIPGNGTPEDYEIAEGIS
jgi:hypothetical protein